MWYVITWYIDIGDTRQDIISLNISQYLFSHNPILESAGFLHCPVGFNLDSVQVSHSKLIFSAHCNDIMCVLWISLIRINHQCQRYPYICQANPYQSKYCVVEISDIIIHLVTWFFMCSLTAPAMNYYLLRWQRIIDWIIRL